MIDFGKRSGNKELIRYFCCFKFIRERVESNLKHQHYGIYHQLCFGCTIFDIKIVKIDHIYYISNIYICARLDDVLEEILFYFNQHADAKPIILLVRPDGIINNEILLAAHLSSKILVNSKITCYCKFNVSLIFSLFKNIKNYNVFDHVYAVPAKTLEENIADIFKIKNISNCVVHLTFPTTSLLMRAQKESCAGKINDILVKKLMRAENLPRAILVDFATSELLKRLLINEDTLCDISSIYRI
jgi:hypothetical protein